MEVPKEKEKQVSTKTSTKENEQKMESYNKLDTISIVSPQTSVTPISTKIPWESFLFKLIYELESIADTIPSLTDYYFNSQTKSIVRRTNKRKHDTPETIYEFSWQAQDDVKEKSRDSSRALGAYVNYNQYHLNEFATSYDKNLQKIKFLEEKLKKNEFFSEENWQRHFTNLIQGFTIQKENLQKDFQKQLEKVNAKHGQEIQELRRLHEDQTCIWKKEA